MEKTNYTKPVLLCGVSGKIGSGKDTVADFIIQHMPDLLFKKKSFAYNVKHIASIISGLPMEDMLSQDGKNKVLPLYGGITVGNLQQVIGTNLFRTHFDDMVWIKSLFAPYVQESDSWIVSDVRFKNEADYIRSLGGIIIRLEGDPGGVRARSTRDMTHASETELDDYEHFDIIMQTQKGEEKERRLVTLLYAMSNAKMNGEYDQYFSKKPIHI